MRTFTVLLATNIVELLMLSYGLRCRADEMLAQMRHPALLLREILLVAVGVPILMLVILHLVPMSGVAASIFMLFAICPAAPYVLRPFLKRKSAAVKALVVVSVGLLSSIVVIPIWVTILNRYFGFEFRVSIGEVVTLLLLKVFMPLVSGILLRRGLKSRSEKAGRVLEAIVAVALVAATILLVVEGAGSLRMFNLRIASALLLVCTSSAALGAIAGGRDPELREILANAAMNGNPAIALAIIGASYPTLQVAGLLAAYILCRSIATYPYLLYTKYRALRRPETAANASPRSGRATNP